MRPTSEQFDATARVAIDVDVPQPPEGECLASGVVDACQCGDAPDGVPSPALFNAVERDFVRRELGMRFGQYPRAANGLYLKTWRGGPLKGEPKLPPAVKSMLERGLVDVRRAPRGALAMFTEAGWVALRAMARDRRALDPERYAHIRLELGLDSQDVKGQERWPRFRPAAAIYRDKPSLIACFGQPRLDRLL